MIPEDAFPEDLSEPYVTALRMALDFIESRPNRAVAVTVSGSVVQGRGDPFSDLDLWIVVEGVHRQRVQRRFNGVPCEMFFNPEARIPTYFEDESKEGRAPSIGMTLDGHVLYDPDGAARRLQELAAQVRKVGPRVPHEAIVQRRYLAVDTLDNARDVYDRDPLMASLLIADAVKSALELSYVLAGMWTPRDKDLSLRLGEACPQAVEPLRSYQRQPTPETADVVLDAILDASTFFEWESAPDSH